MKFERIFKSNLEPIKWGILPFFSSTHGVSFNKASMIASQFDDFYTINTDFFHKEILDSLSANFWFSNNYQHEQFLLFTSKFSYIRKASFVEFFERQNIDVPQCFIKSASLKRSSNELFFLKFSNYLMFDGKKEKFFIILTKVFQLLNKFRKQDKTYLLNNDFSSWRMLYFIFNTNIITTNTRLIIPRIYGTIMNNNFFKKSMQYYFMNNNLYSYLCKYLFRFLPIFNFFLYNTDKRARKTKKKNKSKYLFIYKYIPFYKRNISFLRLLAKDIKFVTGKTLKDRIEMSIRLLISEPHTSSVVQTINQTHQHVFKNFKHSLLTNYKTTS